MLTIKDIHKYYRSKKGGDYQALKGLNVDFPTKGFVFQDFNIIDSYSIGANISLVLQFNGFLSNQLGQTLGIFNISPIIMGEM